MSTQTPAASTQNKQNKSNRLKWAVLIGLILLLGIIVGRALLLRQTSNIQPQLTEFLPIEGTKVRLSGTGVAGQQLRVLINQQREERVEVDGEGMWTVETTAFGQTGRYDIVVTDTEQSEDEVEPVPVAIVVQDMSIASFDAPSLDLINQTTNLVTEEVSTPTSIPTPIPTIEVELAAATVISFRPNVTRTVAGETIQVTWETTTDSNIFLQLFNADGEKLSSQLIPPSGEQSFEVRGDWGNRIVLTLQDDADALNAEATVEITCAAEWILQPAPTECPIEPAIVSHAAQQAFEGGVMIWVQQLDAIFAVSESGMGWQLVDEFEHDTHPVQDDTIIAPEGKQQPLYGLGKAWRESAEIRGALQWAETISIDYNATYQCSYSGTCYLSTLDNTVLVIDANNPWRVERDWTLNLEP